MNYKFQVHTYVKNLLMGLALCFSDNTEMLKYCIFKLYLNKSREK